MIWDGNRKDQMTQGYEMLMRGLWSTFSIWLFKVSYCREQFGSFNVSVSFQSKGPWKIEWFFACSLIVLEVEACWSQLMCKRSRCIIHCGLVIELLSLKPPRISIEWRGNAAHWESPLPPPGHELVKLQSHPTIQTPDWLYTEHKITLPQMAKNM